MKEIKIESVFTVFNSIDETSPQIQQLLQHAINARKKAYAPYSKFLVGAALLLDNGEIVTGNNQENTSYPSGLCAERTAIYYAGSQFPGHKIMTLAISAGSENSVNTEPIPPCGACRQAIAEYEVNQDQPVEIYFMGESGKVVRSDSLANLLPLIFDRSVL